MNSFTYRFTRQCMIPVIILGVLSFTAPAILNELNLIELDDERFAGFLHFDVLPFLAIASIFTIRIILRFRKGRADIHPSIATLLFYLLFSFAYIMMRAIIIQNSDKDGPFIDDWAFVGNEILSGLYVCWLAYWLVQLCRYVSRLTSAKDCVKISLLSFLKAFGLFLLFNVLPMFLLLFSLPFLILVAAQISSLFA